MTPVEPPCGDGAAERDFIDFYKTTVRQTFR